MVISSTVREPVIVLSPEFLITVQSTQIVPDEVIAPPVRPSPVPTHVTVPQH